jgi:hypothetical protein
MAWLRHHDRYNGGDFTHPDLPFWRDAAKKTVAMASLPLLGIGGARLSRSQ